MIPLSRSTAHRQLRPQLAALVLAGLRLGLVAPRSQMAAQEQMTLEELISIARKLPPMTPEQRREQCISFAYGNVKMHNPKITREMVAEQVDALNLAETKTT